jgi:hypothetical protein
LSGIAAPAPADRIAKPLVQRKKLGAGSAVRSRKPQSK